MTTAVYQINSKYVHSSLASWYLAAALREAGFECRVLEGSINEDLSVHIARAEAADADIVALSCYIWNIDTVLTLASSIKERDPSRIVVLGGPEVSSRAEQILNEYGFVDYVLSGEGEVPITELVRALSRGTGVEVDAGISYRGSISAPYSMKTDPPLPYGEEYLRALKGRISYIETSRGCPFGCAYCLSGRDGVRFFDIERSKKDILTLARSGSRTVKFVDRTFNADRARARELFSFIMDAREQGTVPDGVTFHFEIAGELVDASTLELLKKAPAGLFQLEIGVQSFNEKTLKAINRYTDLEKLSDVIREISAQNNIHVHTDLIAGLPHEDIESFRRSYERLAELCPHKIQLGFLKLLHGTDMREKKDIYPCEFDHSAPYKVRGTPWLSADDIRELEYVEWANDKIMYSGRFSRTVEYLMSAAGHGNYSLALELGRALCENAALALDDLFGALYEHCRSMEGVDAEVLRDRLLYDRIECNNSCVIPHPLRVHDTRMRMISDKLAELYPPARGVRRCIGILYSEDKVIFADYDRAHPVTGVYKVKEIAMGDLI